MRKAPALRSNSALKTLGESGRGTHIHSTAPLGATRQLDSQSDRNAYSAIGGNGLCPVGWPGPDPASSNADMVSAITNRLASGRVRPVPGISRAPRGGRQGDGTPDADRARSSVSSQENIFQRAVDFGRPVPSDIWPV